jgi:hypothetical protein
MGSTIKDTHTHTHKNHILLIVLIVGFELMDSVEIEGFDGKVFVTDIIKLAEDIQKGEKKSENSLYPCNEVVGSVAWHPTGPTLSSSILSDSFSRRFLSFELTSDA